LGVAAVSNTRINRLLTAVTLAVGLAVSGCTGDPAKPTPLGTPTASTSMTPTPTAPAPPTLPPEAEGTTAKSAKRFARYYISVVNFSSRTGDTDRLTSLGQSGCQSCSAIAKNIHDVYSAGGSITSDGWKVLSIGAVPKQPRSRPILDLGVYQSPEMVSDAKTEPPNRYKGGKQPMTMQLVATNGTWQVTRLDLVT
jgi:hypothetical protein